MAYLPFTRYVGIGKRTEKTLNNMGIFSVGQLAHYDLGLLEKKLGIMGNQLYHHAWGIDLSEIGAPIMQGQISYGKSQILLRDYKEIDEIKSVLLEMCEDVAKRARSNHHAGRTVTLGISYSKDEFGGGFQRSRTIENPTNVTMIIYQVCLELFHENHRGQTVRQISVSITKLENDDEMQLDLFDTGGWKKESLDMLSILFEIAMDQLPSYVLFPTLLAVQPCSAHSCLAVIKNKKMRCIKC